MPDHTSIQVTEVASWGRDRSSGCSRLQGDVVEHARALAAAGATPGQRCAGRTSSTSVDGLVIPGGESTTMWKLAVIFEMMEPLRKRISGGMPVFGSCAGMIMLADRLLDGVDGPGNRWAGST